MTSLTELIADENGINAAYFSPSSATSAPVNGGKLGLITPANFTSEPTLSTDFCELLAGQALRDAYKPERGSKTSVTWRGGIWTPEMVTISKRLQGRVLASLTFKVSEATILNCALDTGVQIIKSHTDVSQYLSLKELFDTSSKAIDPDIVNREEANALSLLFAEFSVETTSLGDGVRTVNTTEATDNALFSLSSPLGLYKSTIALFAAMAAFDCQPKFDQHPTQRAAIHERLATFYRAVGARMKCIRGALKEFGIWDTYIREVKPGDGAPIHTCSAIYACSTASSA